MNSHIKFQINNNNVHSVGTYNMHINERVIMQPKWFLIYHD